MNNLFLYTGITNELLSLFVMCYAAYAMMVAKKRIKLAVNYRPSIMPLVVIFLYSLAYSIMQFLWMYEEHGGMIGGVDEIIWSLIELTGFCIMIHYIKMYFIVLFLKNN